jgi:CRP-like cAMP-binding protein
VGECLKRSDTREPYLNTADVFEPLIRRLRSISALDQEDANCLRAIPISLRNLRAQQTVLAEGESASQSCIIVSGYCARTKSTAQGRRQIVSIHIPGEMPDLQTLFLVKLDHELCTLTDVSLAFVNHSDIRRLCKDRLTIRDVLWRDTLIEASLLREALLNLGQRPAPSRLAHLLYEVRERLKVLGLNDPSTFEMPLTQEQLGDALGISWVHTSRVVSMLRKEGVIDFSRGRVHVIDEKRFAALAEFDKLYLHQSPSE